VWFALRRWPLVLGGLGCLAFAVYLLDRNGAATAAAACLLVLGAVLLGAFLALYARDTG
jgi:hypothetical protein